MVREIGQGNINTTFCIEFLNNSLKDKIIVQKINNIVFKDDSVLESNYLEFYNYSREKLTKSNHSISSKWKIPSLISRLNGKKFFRLDGTTWRAFSFVENTYTISKISNIRQALESSKGLAFFHYLISSIPRIKLKSSIPHFHDINYHLDVLKQTKMHSTRNVNKKRVDFLVNSLSKLSYAIDLFDFSKKKQIISESNIHGDTKVSNFLFEKDTNEIISLIDIDTLSCDFILNDLADFFRSLCLVSGEEPDSIEEVKFDLDIFDVSLDKYIEEGPSLITSHDLHYLPYAIISITLELCIRFFNDYLAGDNYFKTNYKDHNLFRAEVQMHLALDVHNKLLNLNRIVGSKRRLIIK